MTLTLHETDFVKNKPALLKYHVRYLHDELARRKQKNVRYSLRAFASQLEMHPSALSRILAGKQELSLQAALVLVKKLSLSDEDLRHFIASIAEEKFMSTMDVLRSAIGLPWPVTGLPVHPILDGLFETARDLLAPVGTKDVVDITLKKANATTAVESSAIFSLEGEQLIHVGQVVNTVDSQQPSLTKPIKLDEHHDPRVQSISTGKPIWHESPFSAYIPMMIGPSAIGLAVFSSETPLADDHRLFLVSLVSIATIAFSRARFYETKLGNA